MKAKAPVPYEAAAQKGRITSFFLSFFEFGFALVSLLIDPSYAKRIKTNT